MSTVPDEAGAHRSHEETSPQHLHPTSSLHKVSRPSSSPSPKRRPVRFPSARERGRG